MYIPEGKLYLIWSEVDVVINGEYCLCLDLFEWKESVVETVSLASDNLR